MPIGARAPPLEGHVRAGFGFDPLNGNALHRLLAEPTRVVQEPFNQEAPTLALAGETSGVQCHLAFCANGEREFNDGRQANV